MSGICGWIGASDRIDPSAALQEMMDAFRLSIAATAADQRGTLTTLGRRTRYFADGDVEVGLIGTPRLDDRHGSDRVLQEIARLFVDQPERLPAALHGPFALAVIDRGRGRALLAVDRIGVERMVYARTDHGLVFSNRADSVAAHPDASREVDPQGIFDYLYFHCVPSPRAIFKGQAKLLPGQCLRFEDGQLRTEFYWTMSYKDHQGSFEPLKKAFLDELEASVQRAAADNDPGEVGSFLSGGTDSSTVSGLLTRISGKPARTFSIGFAAEGYDEMEYVRIAEKHFGLDSHGYYVTPEDVLSAIPQISAAFDEPFGNASAVPALLCSRLARENGIDTLLAGDGGDEIYGGNSRYVQQIIFQLYERIPKVLRRAILEPLAFSFPGRDRIMPLRKLGNYIRGYRIPLPDRMETYNFLHRSPLESIFTPNFLESVNTDEPIENIRDAYHRAQSESVLHRMLHLDMKITLADNDLRKVSTMCELAGVNVRYPLLDEDFVDLSGRVPPRLKIKNFKLRYFFKKSLEDLLPKEIIYKKKHGFGLPTGVWLRDDPALRAYGRERLAQLRDRDIIQPEYIEQILQQSDTEHAGYYGVMVWVMLILEEWLQSRGL